MPKTSIKAPPHEIAKSLVISTAHITRQDGEKLQCGCNPDSPSPVVAYEKRGYGFWVHVFGSDEQDCHTDADIKAAGYSNAFLGLLTLARRLKCEWLMLDRDGPVREDLPQFDW
jgi:hypothetical protein